jgi:GxxExxY protein
MPEWRHGDLTYKLRGLIFRVRNELKVGWPEEVYHKVLVQLLEDENIPVLSKPRRALVHRQIEIHAFEPDLIVWNTVILELKALPYQTQFIGEQYAQIIHYLKFFGKDLGLLVNFAPTTPQIKRVLWDESVLEVVEEYSSIRYELSDQDRPYLHRLRHHILEVARNYGLGYPESVYRQIVALEFQHDQMACVSGLEVSARWHDSIIISHETPFLLVANQYLVHIRSLLDFPTQYDFLRMQTYLSNLNLKIGLVVNFGRKQLQIYGVKSK